MRHALKHEATEKSCGEGKHYWSAEADAEGDTCNCGEWYRFADRIELTPPADPPGPAPTGA